MAVPLSSRRSSFSSIGGTSATDTTPHLTIDKRHSPNRRASTDSTIRTPLPNLPGLSSLPGLSHNSPLIAGSPMAPPPPPKERLALPKTPTRKPVQRQKSPLSTEAFSSSSPASIMPGAFPNTPSPGPTVGLPVQQVNTSAYASNTSPEPPSPVAKPNAGKRVSSLRQFFPFKALRRTYGNNSSDSSPRFSGERARASSSMGFRPTTPGAESVSTRDTGHTGHTLRHKISGVFWSRKVSEQQPPEVRMEEPGVADVNGNGVAHSRRSTSSRLNGLGKGTNGRDESLATSDGEQNPRYDQEQRSNTPAPTDEALHVPRKRKSGTFWRRASSHDILSDEAQQKPWTSSLRRGSLDLTGWRKTQEEYEKQQTDRVPEPDPTMDVEPTSASTMEVPFMLRRSPSPPPQLPSFVGGGEGMGDIFKDIL